MHETKVMPLRVRERSLSPEPQESLPEWREPARRRPGEHLLKNLAVSAALVLCAVVLRTGTVPPLDDAADAILTAATDQSLLDEQLGKLSFVSALFPEAVLVFGEDSAELAAPVSGGMVVHTWSESEPWMSWRTSDTVVNASADGEVTGVYHGMGDERMVQVQGQDGLKCIYGNLAEVAVRTGDPVLAGDVIGTLLPGEDFVLEVQQGGKSVDPSRYLQ